MKMSAPTSADADRPAPRGCSLRLSAERRQRGNSHAPLSRICYEFQSETGVLRLCGSLPLYYLKQVAQELDLEGMRLVDNQISVVPPSARGPAQHRALADEADASSGPPSESSRRGCFLPFVGVFRSGPQLDLFGRNMP